MARPAVPMEVRFWRKVNKTDTCWLWTGQTCCGYGAIGTSGIPGVYNSHKPVRAHRYSYELHYGKFPAELNVCHKCDTPLCVNPEHLFLGTHVDNIADKVAKSRQRGGRKRTMTDADELLMKELRASGLTYDKIAIETGYSTMGVYQAIKRVESRV